MILLFLWGTKLAWGVRKASSEFNESKSLMSTIGFISIYLYALINIYFY